MPTPPPIFVDSLRVDGVPQGVSQLGLVTVPELRIDADSRRVEIGYGSPSLAPGDTPRYQVRLRGVDPDWGPATNDRTALYLNLAPGHYRFEARAVASHGLASPRPASVAFTILPPIWQRWWFQLAAGAMVAAAAYSVYRARLSRLLALERVRARLATDLHDDLGARLSRISILAEVAARRVSSDARSAGRLLGEVGETARSLIEAADDITWSVDPRQDDLASLVARIRRFVGELLEARDIAWTFEAPVTGARIKLSPERRRHVLLVFQEASNNVVRHAGARHVVMSLRLDGHQLHAEIQDDGCGFEVAADTDADAAGVRPVSPHAGRGLSNMRARARELGGLLTITSAVGRGTSVRLTAPVR
jgi:signal transduction histidine kinase